MTQTQEAVQLDLLRHLQVGEHGKLVLDGIPSVLMPAAFLRALKATGEKFMGRSFHGIIYHIGEQFGRAMTEANRARQPAEPKVAFERMTRAVQIRGWGRVEILSLDLDQPSCLVSLPDCPHDDEDVRRDHPWCPMVTGFVAGVLGALSGRQVLAEETACRSMGAATCRVSAVGLPPS